MMKKNNPFHMVTQSPWPILSSFQMFSILMLTVNLMYKTKNSMKIPILINMMSTSASWWSNSLMESSKEGSHQKKVYKGLKMGMVLFIISEVFFFVSFFWAFFHTSSNPSTYIGSLWPPMQITPFNPINVPLLNTIILLSSGFSITWSHHSLLNNKKKMFTTSLLMTISLGTYFSIMQSIEYFQASFSINFSCYGSTFFMSTGFHGIHVLIGSLFLFTSLKISNSLNNNQNFHISFELATWYWHFVDVVWLFLFTSIYWWGYK